MNHSMLSSQLDGFSLHFRPPRAWNVVESNDVYSWVQPPRAWNVLNDDGIFSWTIPPQLGGEWCPHVGVYFLSYAETMGGQHCTVHPFRPWFVVSRLYA